MLQRCLVDEFDALRVPRRRHARSHELRAVLAARAGREVAVRDVPGQQACRRSGRKQFRVRVARALRAGDGVAAVAVEGAGVLVAQVRDRKWLRTLRAVMCIQ